MTPPTTAITTILGDLVRLAAEEGRRFEADYGRKPTPEEAARISDTILRQARTAIQIVR